MAHVTVPDVPSKKIFNVSAATKGPFAFEFTYFVKADLRVSVGGVELLQSEFSVTGNGNTDGGFAGGSLTLSSSVSKTKVCVWRRVRKVRSDDVVQGNPNQMRDINTGLDRLTASGQDDQRDIDRSLKIPIEDSDAVSGDMPSAESGKLIGWSTTASRLVNYPGSDDLAALNAQLSENLNEIFGNEAVLSDAGFNLSAAAAIPVAYDRATAISMVDDLSDMKGYAAHSGTNGGAGQTIYWVTSALDSADVGTLRWALSQARTNGGGRIIFDPRGKFVITLRTILLIDMPNVTIAAPGRNVYIYAQRDVTMLSIRNTNIIIRWLYVGRWYGVNGETDGVFVDPNTCDKIWIDQCTLNDHSDGALDMASTAFLPTSTQCRVTISRCRIVRQDKGMIWGSTASSLQPESSIPSWVPNALDETPLLLVTLCENVLESCAQRGPLINSLCYVHSFNNLRILGEYRRDDQTLSAVYGMEVRFSRALSEHDYTYLGAPTVQATLALYAYTEDWSTTTRKGPGALKIVGSVAEDSLQQIESQTSLVNDPPYSVTVAQIPSTEAGRLAFATNLQANAGSQGYPVFKQAYRYSAGNPATLPYPDGDRVLAVRTSGGGRGVFVRESADPTREVVDSAMTVIGTFGQSRGSTVNATSGGVVEMRVNESSFAIDTNASAAIQEIDTITPYAEMPDGTVIEVRAASVSRIPIITDGGNIRARHAIALTTNSVAYLKWEASSSQFYPVSTTSEVDNWGPALTQTTNLSAATWRRGHFSLMQNLVKAEGLARVTATASGNIVLDAELPINVDMDSALDVTGTISGIGVTGIVEALTGTPGKIRITAVMPNTDETDIAFHASYRVEP